MSAGSAHQVRWTRSATSSACSCVHSPDSSRAVAAARCLDCSSRRPASGATACCTSPTSRSAAARKKPVAASKNPNKIKRREGAGGSDDQPAEETLSGEEEKEELPAEEAPVQAGSEEPQDVANERESAEETEPEDRKEN